MWKLVAIYAPILGAVLIAGALTIDEYHNWYDCLAGAIIGTVMAFSAYRMVYAAIWDFRYNHIPLTRLEPFSPNSLGSWESTMWTRKAGCGRASDGRHRPNSPATAETGDITGADRDTGYNNDTIDGRNGYGSGHRGDITGTNDRHTYESDPGYDATARSGATNTQTYNDPLANVTHVNEGRRNSRSIGRRPVGSNNFSRRGDQLV
jgi:hypothetical protein